MQSALTDQRYWDAVWQFTDDHAATPAPRVVPGPIASFLDAAFAARLGPGRRFLEVGAGGSAWPAHVASAHRAESWGVDFSAGGLALAARAVLPGAAPVHLVEGDLFDDAKLPTHHFDVIYSGGFVEHFPSPRELMERFARLLAPGGVVVTGVPNLCGVNGVLQRLLDAETFARHVVLSPSALDAAHRTGGLYPVEPARYIGVVDPGAVNFARVAERLPGAAWRGLSFALAKLRRAGVWYGLRTGEQGGRWWAPMVAGIYRAED